MGSAHAFWAKPCRLWAAFPQATDSGRRRQSPPLPVAPATFLPVQLPLGSNPQDGGTEVASADTGKEAVPGVGRGGDSTDVATQPRDWMVKSGPPTTLLLLLLVFPERKKPCRFVLLSVAPILTQCLFPHRPLYLPTPLPLQRLAGAHEKRAHANQEFTALTPES